MAEYNNLSLDELLRHTHDSASWYWIGMSYWEQYDFINAAKWLEKTMDDYGNTWAGKATLNLGLLHAADGIPNASKDEALRLFEKNSNGAMSKLNAGFLYYNGTETKRDLVKGRELIEAAVIQLRTEKGDDSYLKQNECYDIGWMYYKEKDSKAYEWFDKCIVRCDSNYSSDRELIKLAERNIEILHRDGV